MSPIAMRSPGSTFRSARNLSFAKFDSKRCAFSTSFSTNAACESLNVLLTKPMSSDEHVIVTSSRIYMPCRGVLTPFSAVSFGSPGNDPPTLHLPRMSRPSGA